MSQNEHFDVNLNDDSVTEDASETERIEKVLQNKHFDVNVNDDDSVTEDASETERHEKVNVNDGKKDESEIEERDSQSKQSDVNEHNDKDAQTQVQADYAYQTEEDAVKEMKVINITTKNAGTQCHMKSRCLKCEQLKNKLKEQKKKAAVLAR